MITLPSIRNFIRWTLVLPIAAWCWSMSAATAPVEIATSSTPPFLTQNGTSWRVWTMTLNQSQNQLQIKYSDDYGDTWTNFGSALDATAIGINTTVGPPYSMYVQQPSGYIFFSDIPTPAVRKQMARIWRVD